MPTDTDITTIKTDECETYTPEAALIVFSNGSDRFIELRPIRRDGSMGAARGVSKDFIQGLLSSFSKEYRSVPHGETPPNLLYCDTRRGRETYIWYTPPGRRSRYFDSGLGLENGTYHVPGTIYAVRESRISVFCFAGNKPKPGSKLLGVPYFNVYRDGSVCMGSASPKMPDKEDLSFADILSAWENAFWNSVDVHTNGSPSTKGNLIETIRRYKDRPFDTKELKERTNPSTLENLIKSFAR